MTSLAKFECAVTVDGIRCASLDQGGIYLGALTFCHEHYYVFEDLVTAGQLASEVRASKLNRILDGPTELTSPRQPIKSKRYPNMDGRAYFIRCGGYIKIGSSRTPEARFNVIRRTGGVLAPFPLDLSSAELVATEPGGFKREKDLHAKFKHLRNTGEWFTEAPELTKYIDALVKKAA